MKRLLVVGIVGSALLLTGACASQSSGYGYGGGGGFGYYPEDRYYDCYERANAYDCGYRTWVDNQQSAQPLRQTVLNGPVHRPVPHLIERTPIRDGPAARALAERGFGRSNADFSSAGSAGYGTSSGGSTGGGPPASAPTASFSSPAPAREPVPVSSSHSPN